MYSLFIIEAINCDTCIEQYLVLKDQRRTISD